MPEQNDKLAEYTMLILGVVICVALICYTLMSVFSIEGRDTMLDVLVGLNSAILGAFILLRHHGKKKGS